MNKLPKLLTLLFATASLYACGTVNYDYTPYYSYKENLKGIEVYCWENYNSWYAGILPGTNRLKTTDEVKWLQNYLPCPFSKMNGILKTYPDDGCTFVCIVSIPPKEEELTHDTQLIYDKIDTYKWVYDQLGLKFQIEQ